MSDQNFLDPSKFKRCPKCNCDVTSEQMKTKSTYTWVGWFFWSMGTTVIPKKILFTCSKCNILVSEETDRKLIEYYITYKKY